MSRMRPFRTKFQTKLNVLKNKIDAVKCLKKYILQEDTPYVIEDVIDESVPQVEKIYTSSDILNLQYVHISDDEFDTIMYKALDISKEEKSKYLRSNFEVNALDAIAGQTPTDANYKEAILNSNLFSKTFIQSFKSFNSLCRCAGNVISDNDSNSVG